MSRMELASQSLKRRDEDKMTERTTNYRPFPRGPLFGAGALVVLTLILAAMSRLTGVGTTTVDEGNAVVSRDLRFEDRNDGAVAVLAAKDDKVVEILPPGTNGFVRGVLRGLARERKLEGIGIEPPFRLTEWDDGRLSLEDRATGRRVELVSFGQTQFDVFAQMLKAAEDTK
jgi:putative photosynthetic complex assembly protein